jgi:signal transduction histidine kinase/CheY-like chemotaxis protein
MTGTRLGQNSILAIFLLAMAAMIIAAFLSFTLQREVSRTAITDQHGMILALLEQTVELGLEADRIELVHQSLSELQSFPALVGVVLLDTEETLITSIPEGFVPTESMLRDMDSTAGHVEGDVSYSWHAFEDASGSVMGYFLIATTLGPANSQIRAGMSRISFGVTLVLLPILLLFTRQVHRLELSLHGAREGAERATKIKDVFLANMSHEMRTPLTAILGYVDLLQGGNVSTEKHSEYLSIVSENGDHLLVLINDILDLSKVEAGRMEVERIPTSLPDLLRDLNQLLELRVRYREVSSEIRLAGPIPATIHTDPVRLRQILLNLVGNALKFTYQGQVRVSASVDATKQPHCLRIVVEDTGIGMTEDEMSRVFDPFTQADGSTTRRFGGTGLGLAVSLRLARLLGGDITVQSEHGVGSSFVLTIDLGSLDGVAMVESLGETALPMKIGGGDHSAALEDLQANVLVAEDNPVNQKLLRLILEKAGVTVDLVENGVAAVDAALFARETGHPYDLVLMDMFMPILDGHTATHQLRTLDYRGPIVALTASAMAEDREKCLAAGCDDFLTKPIDRKRLLEVVKSAVGNGGKKV